MKTSINGCLLVTPYKNEGVKSEVSRGMSFVKHAVSLVKLELLANYKDSQREYKKGTFVYFKESDLGSLQWAKEVMKDGLVEGNYILARLENVVVVEEKDEELPAGAV